MASYKAELTFFEKLLDNFHLPHTILTPEAGEIPEASRGIFRLKGEEGENLWSIFAGYEGNVIYRVTSEYMYRYLFFRLPDMEQPSVLLIGPYMVTGVEKEKILHIAERISLPEKYVHRLEQFYTGLTKLSEEGVLLSIVNVFGEKIWGSIDGFRLQEISDSGQVKIEVGEEAFVRDGIENPRQIMKILEERYREENRLIHAVAKGQTHKAEAFMNGFTVQWLEQRSADALRNMKNYMIICNTLFRKAAESADVHPLHIDDISSRFAHKIERLTSQKDVTALCKEMVRKYCFLVKNHSLKNYSLLVRKALVQIDADLTADLSLKAQAAQLGVNASYLSTLFKKETGKTLTEYVNGKRIEQAIFLLNSTNLQIQTIAGYCGIPDVNYFAKMFKKAVGKTPKEYRDGIQR